jgi:hypothetical protein
MHQRQVAFDAAQIKVVVQAHHQQRGVDVAGQRLARAIAGAANQAGYGIEARRNQAAGVGQHPVADRQLLLQAVGQGAH